MAPLAPAGRAERVGLLLSAPLLSHAECTEIADRVRALRERWVSRGSGFYTLGRAVYLDVMNDGVAERDYFGNLPESNALLRTEFGDLLERVRAQAEVVTGLPAVYDERLALPGFHVFEGIGIPAGDQPTMHFDLQFHALDWAHPPDQGRPVSITLVIEVPANGSGMDTWNLEAGDLERRARAGRVVPLHRQVLTKPVIRTPYLPGVTYFQDRLILHRIGGTPGVTETDFRITLQAHGVQQGSELVLYW